MIKSTRYVCEVCGASYSFPDHAKRCEAECVMLQRTIRAMCDPGPGAWTPQVPLYRLREWSDGDKKELGRRMVRLINLIKADENLAELLKAGKETDGKPKADSLSDDRCITRAFIVTPLDQKVDLRASQEVPLSSTQTRCTPGSPLCSAQASLLHPGPVDESYLP